MREALADGRPVVALESTIFTHGLPRPRNVEVALQAEHDLRAAGVVPATIGVLHGVPTVGLTADEIRGARRRRRRDQGQPARPADRGGPATIGRHDGGRHGLPGGPGRDRGLRHRRPRRRAPRRVRDVRRVRRPARARPDADPDGLGRREVDPRRRRQPGAAGDAVDHAGRVPDDALPRLLPGRLGVRDRLRGRQPRRGRGPGARPRRPGRARRDPGRQPRAVRAPAGPRPPRPGAGARPWPRWTPRGSAATTPRRTCSTTSSARPRARASTSTWRCTRTTWGWRGRSRGPLAG